MLEELSSNSMSDFREALWENNANLKEAFLKYVGLQRREMLDFLTRDFPLYAWSLRMLDRRLRHFDILFNDGTYKVDLVMKTFETEPNGPGKLSGYRAMHKKMRQEYGLNVTKDQVYDVMNKYKYKYNLFTVRYTGSGCPISRAGGS